MQKSHHPWKCPDRSRCFEVLTAAAATTGNGNHREPGNSRDGQPVGDWKFQCFDAKNNTWWCYVSSDVNKSFAFLLLLLLFWKQLQVIRRIKSGVQVTVVHDLCGDMGSFRWMMATKFWQAFKNDFPQWQTIREVGMYSKEDQNRPQFTRLGCLLPKGLKPLGNPLQKRSQLDPLPSRKQIIYPTRKGKGINNRLKHTFWLGYVSLVPQQKSHRAENKTGERRWISCGSLATQKRSLPRILVEKSIPNKVCFSQSLLQTQNHNYQTLINYDAGSGFLGIILPGW